MRVVVTGAAGFIGSHLVGALRAAGHDVTGADLAGADVRCDLATDDLRSIADTDLILHLAGRPGVRSSWGDGAAGAHRDNVVATRRLLEAAAGVRFVFASSSSVYGDAGRPCTEDDPVDPRSPYAESKAEAELLVRAADNTVILRYFSVYGPRQRPDMAFHRFVEAALDGTPAPLYGDGGQSRSFTYVGDVVDATIRAAETPLPSG
ncbi:MAG TPA: NAD-dependent epimerase/dehydratase family protein, partial [Actinoplanes sp.]|nr:NAD-dependent epimerase/dehydratase family protein [Actinoplanes sp.]